MTNHWADIGNASMVLAIGANPSENHPACMAHVNAARYDIHYDDAGAPVSFGGRKAKLVVVDPRKTRTAIQADLYVRIRPGTDIAFINGLLNWIFADFESASPYNATAATNFFAYHNGTTANSTSFARTFIDDSGSTRTLNKWCFDGATYDGAAAPGFSSTRGWPKGTDARCKLKGATSCVDDKITFADTLTAQSYVLLGHAAVTAPILNVYSATLGGGTPYAEGTDYVIDYTGGRIKRTATSSIGITDVVYASYSYKCDDYARTQFVTGIDYSAGNTTTYTFSNMLYLLNDIRDAGSVYSKLKDHCAPYDLATVADICGCQQAEIVAVAKAFIDNCRFADANYASSLATNGIDVTQAGYKASTILYAMGATQHTKGSQNVRSYAVIQSMLGNMGRPGGGINALRGIHNVQGSTDMGVLYDLIPAYSGNPGTATSYATYSNALFGNRVKIGSDPNNPATVIKTGRSPYTPADLGLQQRGFYNMTREWFGDSTTPTRVDVVDEAVVLSGTAHTHLANASLHSNPAVVVKDGVGGATYAATNYMINFVDGTIEKTATSTIPDGTVYVSYSYDPVMDKYYSLWPKGNGYQHITAFRNMISGSIKGAVVWGQNPCVTEPNQKAVRAAFKNLDVLVCVDMFANETAECERKEDLLVPANSGVTYLLPACSHVEEAGSVANSGRWLQWRDRATTPRGNSKADLELLLRFAKALDTAGAFSHISGVWATIPALATKNPWDVLYGKYGSPVDAGSTFPTVTPWDGLTSFDALTGSDLDGNTLTGSEYVADRVFWEMARPLDLNSGKPYGGGGTFDATNGYHNNGGTIWIYSGAGLASGYSTTSGKADTQPSLPVTLTTTTDESIVLTNTTATNLANKGVFSVTSVKSSDGLTTYVSGRDYIAAVSSANTTSGSITRTANSGILSGATVLVTYKWDTVGRPWTVCNRAKSRNSSFAGNARNFPRYGWAWLLNRRVQYNNGEVQNEVVDGFVSAGLMARMFVINTNTLAEWSAVYRAYNTLADVPSTELTGTKHVAGGRIPAHTEPIESPRDGTDGLANLQGTWGVNTGRGADLFVTSDALTPRGNRATYPLVLTTIRCVEHFQGGPITRNNSWNVEAEPEPWIEINSVDARKYGIKDGTWVNVVTARSNSTSDQLGRTATYTSSGSTTDNFGKGFRARVGVGIQANQRVAPGVVAIPWHWGDRGLSTGSRANDLTIDAWDANTTIPEYKACLCRIETA